MMFGHELIIQAIGFEQISKYSSSGDFWQCDTTKGAVLRCNFSCNLQRNSTVGRCKIGKYMFPSQFTNIFLTFVTNLHLLRVELRCKLQEKLHRVTGP